MKNYPNSTTQNLPLTPKGDRQYRDFYKVIVDDETRADWNPVIRLLKQEFLEYPSAIEWQPPLVKSYQEETGKVLFSIGTNSKAYEGNFLEAINLTLNELSKHHIDRDLKHTGQSIIVLSAGSGYFRVPRGLADLTKQKIIDNGIGCDLISVSRAPLHAVPLFHYTDSETKRPLGRGQLPLPRTPNHILSFIDGHEIYKFPYWIYISFFGADNNKNDVLVSNLMESLFGTFLN